MPSRETSGFKRVSSLVMSSKRIRYLDQLPKSSQWTCWIDVCVCLMVSCHICIYIYITIVFDEWEWCIYNVQKHVHVYIYIYIYIYILWFGCVLCMHLPLQQRLNSEAAKPSCCSETSRPTSFPSSTSISYPMFEAESPTFTDYFQKEAWNILLKKVVFRAFPWNKAFCLRRFSRYLHLFNPSEKAFERWSGTKWPDMEPKITPPNWRMFKIVQNLDGFFTHHIRACATRDATPGSQKSGWSDAKKGS